MNVTTTTVTKHCPECGKPTEFVSPTVVLAVYTCKHCGVASPSNDWPLHPLGPPGGPSRFDLIYNAVSHGALEHEPEAESDMVYLCEIIRDAREHIKPTLRRIPEEAHGGDLVATAVNVMRTLSEILEGK